MAFICSEYVMFQDYAGAVGNVAIFFVQHFTCLINTTIARI